MGKQARGLPLFRIKEQEGQGKEGRKRRPEKLPGEDPQVLRRFEDPGICIEGEGDALRADVAIPLPLKGSEAMEEEKGVLGRGDGGPLPHMFLEEDEGKGEGDEGRRRLSSPKGKEEEEALLQPLPLRESEARNRERREASPSESRETLAS